MRRSKSKTVARSRFKASLRSCAQLQATEDRNVLLSGGIHLSKFPARRAHDIRLDSVVLAAHYCCFRPIPTPRHFRLGQGGVGDRIGNISIHFRAWISAL